MHLVGVDIGSQRGGAATASLCSARANSFAQNGSDASGKLATFPIAADTALMTMTTGADRTHNYDKDMPAEIVHMTNIATARASERLVLGRDEQYLRVVVAEAGIEGAPAHSSTSRLTRLPADGTIEG